MARQLGTIGSALLATVLLALPLVPPGAAEASPSVTGRNVVTHDVVFEVENTNGTKVACVPDNKSYRLRGQLIGPRNEVLGADADRVNVLVHDASTGSWFWHLRQRPAYDYAARLADRGETSLVLDRLGYDRSPLKDGQGTCLGAQADMLHQVVQHLRSGQFVFTDTTLGAPHAQHVVLHGHSLGASIAQVEAATFDDVDALVLMSWSDRGPSRLAVDRASRQSTTCLQGREYAPFATSASAFRRGLFVTAPPRVQRVAARLRNPDPCGDVLSLSTNQATSGLTAGKVEPPVLLLFGGKDAYTRDGSAREQAQSYSAAESVTTRVVRGAGSALPLERSAPRTRDRVVGWLRSTLD